MSLRQTGKTQQQIATMLGVSQPLVNLWLDKSKTNIKVDNSCKTPDVRVKVARRQLEAVVDTRGVRISQTGREDARNGPESTIYRKRLPGTSFFKIAVDRGAGRRFND